MKTKSKQRSFRFMNWGGKRRGAGRKPNGAKAGVSHGTRERVTRHTPALVTMRVREGLLSLRADKEHEILKCARLETAHESFRVVHYSIQSNHLHLIVEATDN